ncbi:hypothetical protein GCM10012275_27120 [Longimycelium tulufanense]|uniref:Carrier domain-containing protein n=1 Tax=Longimycelium tulufanense TaxID=907463 RepID=A0A8J3FUF4_9PSEU|nr:FkbM family methyltransferase [Longimycelium tulufanense]GGM54565.1 hypothetical protein GCM10012275_27120 [Longimycelium tulufanense]
MTLSSPLRGRSTSPNGPWVLDIGVDRFPYLVDHRLQEAVVLPGSVYLEMALAATTDLDRRPPPVVNDISFEHVFIVPPYGTREVRVQLSTPIENGRECVISSGTGVRHATALVGSPATRTGGDTAGILDPTQPYWTQGVELTGDAMYDRLRGTGNHYGPAFRVVSRCYVRDRAAMGVLRAPARVAEELHRYLIHPTVLDSATHVLAAAADVADRTFALVGCNQLLLHRSPGATGRAYARIRTHAPGSDELEGDVLITDDNGRPLVEMSGLRLRLLPLPKRADPPATVRPRIVVAATFTAEPLEEPLSFWFHALDTPADIEFAGYNQVFQQLLDPGSPMSTNTDGANVVLVRPTDWLRNGATPLASAAEPRQPLPPHWPRRTLPGIGEIAHLVSHETDFLYDEIFSRRSYLQHGVELHEGCCVLDVGANIGLFTLFVHAHYPNSWVYAFEPAPPVYEVLRMNTSAHCPGTKVFNFGLADRAQRRPFTFYRNSPAFSSFVADPSRDGAAIRTIVRNMLRPRLPEHSPHLAPLVEQLTQERLDADVSLRETRTLSSVISQYGIECVDLLKIDTEGSENAILSGIQDEHWPLIRQIVIEVHRREDVEQIRTTLLDRGYNVVVDNQHDVLTGTGFTNVFARRPTAAPPRIGGSAEATLMERNARDLVRALRTHRQLSSAPCIVVVCPSSPVPTSDPGRKAVVRIAEQEMVDRLKSQSDVIVVTPEQIQDLYPVANPHDEYTDQLGRVPYTVRYFAALGTVIARKYVASRQLPVKVLALDCDHTLWTGACGEESPAELVIDTPRRKVQEFAIRQQEQGTLLVLCSKNDSRDVLSVFAHRMDMPLTLQRLTAHRLNWKPKSTNIVSLANELNLSSDSFVLLDDDPVECAEVLANCPDAVVLRIPDVAAEVPDFLEHVWAFDRPRVTDEDRTRAARYLAEKRRSSLRNSSLTFEGFLTSLDLRVEIRRCTPEDYPRVAQLTLRTNQFTTRAVRHSETDLHHLLASGVECLAVRVTDRFGDYGLVGAMLYRPVDDTLTVNTFLLSCRALGRGVEHRMLSKLGELALAGGLAKVEVPFEYSGRNEPACRFFQDTAETLHDDGSTALFIVAASAAAHLTFRPEAAMPRDTNRAEPATTAARGYRLPSSLYQHIADDLRDLDSIVSAIENWRTRRKPTTRRIITVPRDDVEQELVNLWRRVLGTEEIGVDDNFFELGGTSLRAVQVMSELSDRVGRTMPVADLFQRPTVAAMASMLRDGEDPSDRVGEVGHARGRRRRAVHRAGGRGVRRRRPDDG